MNHLFDLILDFIFIDILDFFCSGYYRLMERGVPDGQLSDPQKARIKSAVSIYSAVLAVTLMIGLAALSSPLGKLLAAGSAILMAIHIVIGGMAKFFTK